MSNAKRFGGAHSPKAGRPAPEVKAKTPRSPLSGRKAKRFSWRVLGIYVAAVPLFFSVLYALLFGMVADLLWAALGSVAIILGAWLTSEGLRAEAAYDERVIAKPPSFPRKLCGAVLVGLAVAGVAVVSGASGLIVGVVAGVVATGAHIASFGLDPMSAKGVDGLSDVELDRVAEKVERAEVVVAETVAAAEKLRDRSLTDRIDRLAYSARDILKEIQADPRDLNRSRRFLSVHLVGLRDATVKFADAAGKGAADDLRDRYASLLGDLETSFEAHRTALLSNDQTDLEVEIDVLRDRLKN